MATDDRNDTSSHHEDDVSLYSHTQSVALRNEDCNANNEVKELTSEETKQIWIWKSLVILIIAVTAAVVSAGAYILLDREEDSNYHDNYDQVVNTIRDASEFHASNIYITLRSFSHTITVEARGLNQTFPFVLFPSYEAIATTVRSATGAELVLFYPKVEDHELQAWSNFARDNYKQNLAESRRTGLALQAEGSSIKPSDFEDGDIIPYPYIPNFKEGGFQTGKLLLAPDYGPGPYWPVWMISPPIFNPSFINSDPKPWALKGAFAAIEQVRQPIFTDTIPAQNLANRAINVDDHEAYHKSLVDYVHEEGENAFLHPHSSVMVPVFQDLNDPSSEMIGGINVVIPWDRYLVNLLPEGVDGITCVLRNNCGKAWTYELAGNSAFYLGEGDFHDPAYSNTEVIIPFQDPAQPWEGTDVVPGECRYFYHIYATKEFENDYRSNLPWALTLVVAVTFAAMIITFMVYDIFVHRRNSKVVGHATKTNALVSSLFPDDVKHRLLEQEEKKKSQDRADSLSFFLNQEKQQKVPTMEGTSCAASTMCSSDPIANLYQECTVYFADIAGFTNWSSAREPVDVFRLLEAIYSEFDRLAKRRGVFKVETIGDCYVAITGVPEPCRDHALKMAKFAWETRERLRVVTKSLETRLGPGTGDLDIRIGLHSGSVTAGVLRGEKSRFQLFGDTVNTASRMESNGERGKIQVSAATAEHLQKVGKDAWLTARKDLIEAKGKGKMQTYWLELTKRAGTSSGMSSLGIAEHGEVDCEENEPLPEDEQEEETLQGMSQQGRVNRPQTDVFV